MPGSRLSVGLAAPRKQARGREAFLLRHLVIPARMPAQAVQGTPFWGLHIPPAGSSRPHQRGRSEASPPKRTAGGTGPPRLASPCNCSPRAGCNNPNPFSLALETSPGWPLWSWCQRAEQIVRSGNLPGESCLLGSLSTLMATAEVS